MGEAYKGLTIRIGANTTLLESALKNINRSLTSTQTLLNIVNRGLKFDPSGAKLLASQVDLTGEKLTESTTKLELMRRKYEELAKDKSIVQMANAQENFGLRVQRTHDELAKVTNTLEANHIAMKKINDELGLGFSMKGIKGDVDGFHQAVMQSANATEEQKAEVDKLTQSCQRLSPEVIRLDTEVKQLGKAQEMRKLGVQVEQVEAEVKALAEQMTQLRIAELQAEQSGEGFKLLKADMATTEVVTKALKDELEKLEAAAELDPRSIEVFEARTRTAKEYTKQLNMELEQQRAELRNLESQGVGKVSSSMREIKEDVRSSTAALVKMRQNMAQVETEISAARSQLDLINQEQKEGNTLTTEQLRERNRLTAVLQQNKAKQVDLNAAITRMEQEVVRATNEQRYRELRGAIQSTTAAINAQNEAVKRTRISMDGLRDFATMLGSSVTPVVTMAAYKVISAADEIDSAFRDMKKTVDGTEEQFESLRQAALEFSQTHPVSADTILEIEAMGGQLGIAVENLEGFAEVASNLDIATDIDADTIAQQLGQMMNVMQLTGESAEDFQANVTSFGDALVRLGNNLPAQESAIMNIATRMASVGTLVDMSADEILAWSAAAASTGQGAEALGTNLSKVLGQMEAAVGGYRTGLDDGIKHTKQFAEIIGISANEFADMWDRSATEALRTFIAALRQVDEDGGYVDAALQEMEITSIREKTALEGLTNTLGVLDDALKMSKDAWDGQEDTWGAAGDAAREAANKSEGFSGALQILKNNVQVLGAEVGDALTPLLRVLADALGTVADAFDGMPKVMQGAIIGLGGLTIVAGPVLRAISQFSLTFGNVGAAAEGAGRKVRTLGAVLQTSSAKASLYGQKVDKAQKKQVVFNTATQMAGERVDYLKWKLRQGEAELAASGSASEKAAIKVKLLGTQAKITALQSEFLGRALAVTKGLMLGIATTVAISAFMKLAESVKENNRRTREFNESTKKLYEISRKQLQVTGEIAAANKNYAPSFATVREEVDALIEAQVQLANTLGDIDSQAESDIAELEFYTGIVKELADGTKRSAAEQDALKNALDKVNDILGTGYKVAGEYNTQLQDEAGNILESVDALDKYIEAKEKEIRLKAYEDEITESIKAKVEAERALADAKEQTASIQQKYDEAVTNGDANAMAYYKAQLDEAKKAEEDAARALETRINTLDNLKEKLIEVDAENEKIAEAEQSIAEDTALAKENMAGFSGAVNQMAESTTIVEGVKSVIGKLGGEAETQTGVMTDAISSLSKQWSIDFDGISQSTQDTMGKIDTAITDETAKMPTYGVDMGLELSSGMDLAAPYIAQAAENWASILRSILGFSLPEKGPLRQVPIWPMHMAQEWAKGAEQAIPIYQDASSRVADAIASGLDTAHILEARDQAINMSMDAPTLGSTYIIYQTSVNGAVLNDDIQIQAVSRNFLTELMRKVDA